MVFLVVGIVLEGLLLSEEFGMKYGEKERELLRASHVHGLLLAFFNIFYGMLIDNAKLTERQKKAGSVHAIIGMFLLPLPLIFAGFIPALRYLAPIGGLAIIFAAFILFKGYWLSE